MLQGLFMKQLKLSTTLYMKRSSSAFGLTLKLSLQH